MPPFQKKQPSVIEAVEPVRETRTAEVKDRRDSVKIGDIVYWYAPSNNKEGRPCPAMVFNVGGRRTLGLYVFSESGPRVITGARHWTDPDFSNRDVDATQLSSWSFNDE